MNLYLLGFAKEGQPANGDLIIQECEAQAKLRPHNFEWPHWRNVTARLGEKHGRTSRATAYQPAKKMLTRMPAKVRIPPKIQKMLAARRRTRRRKTRGRLILWRRLMQRTRSSASNWIPYGKATGRSGRHAKKCRMRCTGCARTSLGYCAKSEKALWDAMPPPPPPHTPVSQPEPISETAPEPEPRAGCRADGSPLSEAQIGPTG